MAERAFRRSIVGAGDNPPCSRYSAWSGITRRKSTRSIPNPIQDGQLLKSQGLVPDSNRSISCSCNCIAMKSHRSPAAGVLSGRFSSPLFQSKVLIRFPLSASKTASPSCLLHPDRVDRPDRYTAAPSPCGLAVGASSDSRRDTLLIVGLYLGGKNAVKRHV